MCDESYKRKQPRAFGDKRRGQQSQVKLPRERDNGAEDWKHERSSPDKGEMGKEEQSWQRELQVQRPSGRREHGRHKGLQMLGGFITKAVKNH